MSKSKKKAVQLHAKRRLQERFPSVPQHQLKLWGEQARAGELQLIEVQSLTRKKYRVMHEGVELDIIYNCKFKEVVTVLYTNSFFDVLDNLNKG